jgi:2-succinyl-5-enolpyruvyl-6-hydroxy-3-cyclohexene-1-carboxylate synthase
VTGASANGPSASALARRLIGELLACHVSDAVLSPGSRSGPLALALAAADAQGLLRLHVRVDEREAAFLALGMAKAARRIVPVVTTSGTAVANLHPAMLEAAHSRVPLLAITADRPARLRGTGANQTTEQRHLFGSAVPFIDRVDLVGRVDGPQHLNLELDEPLVEPVAWDFELPTSVESSTPEVVAEPVLSGGPPTVVVAGDDARQPARVLALEARWPLLAEPSSGSRNGEALTAHTLLLEHSPLAACIERVISFGHATLSRSVTRLLARPDVEVVHVGDPSTFPVPAGPNVRFVQAVSCDAPDDPAWLAEWQAADAAARAAIDEVLDDSPASPHGVARTVSAAVPAGGLLFIGSSSPIRDLDLVARPYVVGERRLLIANRGLAGIDGTLSSAIGAALARDSTRAIAYVGDLTFLHGSNGLLIGPGEPRPDLTIVVVNDDGGSIFSTLEQGDPAYATAFERVYATPTGADVGALCAGYGVAHRRVDPVDLATALEEPVDGIRVLEVPVDRASRRALGQTLSAAVAATVG